MQVMGAQTKVKILAEGSRRDKLCQVAIGCAYDTGATGSRPVRSQLVVGSVLKKSQEFNLGGSS